MKLVKKWRAGAKFALQTAVIFLLVSWAMDWLRRPVEPENAAREPLVLLSGETLTLQDFSRDRVVLVYFWGSWCSVCRYQSPIVNELAKDGIPVLGVAVRSGNNAQTDKYMKQHKLDFSTINDERGELAKQWHIMATPALVLLKNGRMVRYTTGISSYWGLRARIFQADVSG